MAKVERRISNFDKAFSKLHPGDLDYIVKKIQATEGGKELLNIENLLFSSTDTTGSEAGTTNLYKGYDAQVIETYLKYNGLRDIGCWLTKSIVDIRSSFISGEGISVAALKPKTSKWIDKFLRKNKLYGSKFFRAVKGSEMTGKILFILKYNEKENIVKINRIPYGNITNESGDSVKEGVQYSAENNGFDYGDITEILVKDGSLKKTIGEKNFIYIVTGGDDTSINDTGTKTGAVLTEIENYDKGLKDLRRVNYVVNRITPDFECKDASEATKTAEMIVQTKWKIGKARVGTGKFEYKTPSTNAHQNIETELQANAKAISTTTGIPVHWLGHVELMSNRSTAETLYESIDNATKIERTVIADGIYDMIIKAMELEIDSGKGELNRIDYDFEVKIPLISFRQFKDNIAALSKAYQDKAISIDDYRNFIPGIDPMQTKKAIEEEEKKEKDDFKTPLDPNIMDTVKIKDELDEETQFNKKNIKERGNG